MALGIFDFLSFLLWVNGCLSARGIEWVSLFIFIFIFLIYNYFLSLFCHFCYFYILKIFLKKIVFFLVMLVNSSSFQY